jgi:hypothetical protein
MDALWTILCMGGKKGSGDGVLNSISMPFVNNDSLALDLRQTIHHVIFLDTKTASHDLWQRAAVGIPLCGAPANYIFALLMAYHYSCGSTIRIRCLFPPTLL